ncbi:MAG: SRPBCC family protein [Gemmatimonadota bacterium]
MRRWLLYGLLSVVGLALLAIGVGFLLPVDHQAVSRADFTQPDSAVWAAVRDMGRYPEWWSDLESAERAGAGGGAAVVGEADPALAGLETWVQSGPRVGTLMIHIEEDDPPRRLVTRIGEGLPFGGRWIYEVEPAPGGSRLTITEAGEIYNPVFRVVSRFLLGYHGTMDSYLRDLGRHFGQEVVPEHVVAAGG